MVLRILEAMLSCLTNKKKFSYVVLDAKCSFKIFFAIVILQLQCKMQQKCGTIRIFISHL